MQTKNIDTKYKEIYFTPELMKIETEENSDSKIMFMMDLIAFQNIAFMQTKN